VSTPAPGAAHVGAAAATGNASATPTGHPAVRLGLRENLPQFTLLVIVNALVGATLRQERTVLPLLAEQEFQLSGYTRQRGSVSSGQRAAGKVVPRMAVRGHRGDGQRGVASLGRLPGVAVSQPGYYDALSRPPWSPESADIRLQSAGDRGIGHRLAR
jgi:hypothetical protein